MTEELEETDLDNMSQEELDELQNQLDQELKQNSRKKSQKRYNDWPKPTNLKFILNV